MKYALRFVVFAGIATALCLVAGCGESDQEKGSGGGYNVLRGNAPRLERDGYGYRVTQEISEGFKPSVEKTTNGFVSFGIVAVFAVIPFAAFFIWQAWKRQQDEKERNDPNGLLRELIRVHKLSDQEKHLIKRLSDRSALSSPLELFVEPKFLLDALKNDSWASAHPSVRRLLSKLFDIHTADQSAAGEETVLISKSSLP
ncbi:MAG: hypothetical protein FWG73_07040 [Planctomycetaceae bacterium]|nr:hypothetical protein [Planctomycetaceae bacterium]